MFYNSLKNNHPNAQKPPLQLICRGGMMMNQATSHLYFSTLYSGTNGIMIGTVFTYC